MKTIENLKADLISIRLNNITDEEVYEALNWLSVEKKFIIKHRYSLGVDFKTLEEIATIRAKTKHWVKGHESTALRHMAKAIIILRSRKQK